MADTQETKVVIGGDSSGAQRAAKDLADTMQAASRRISESMSKTFKDMQAGWGSTLGVLKTAQGAMLGLGAALAGGAVMKAAIDDTVQFAKEVNGLAKTLGISAAEATAWNVALGDIYKDADALQGAIGKLNRVIAEDEDKINKLGVATRDSNGHLRAQGDIFLDVAKHLNTFTEGTDRNIEGTRIFGKGWADVSGLLKLGVKDFETAETAIDKARKKAEDLGLTLTDQAQNRVKNYRAAMNDVGDVLLGLKNAIGQAMMPVLARLGEWFSEIGPRLVNTFRLALNTLSTAVQGVMLVFRALWMTVETVANPISTFIDAMHKFTKGDFAGAQKDMMGMFSKWGDSFSTLGDRIKAESVRTWQDVSDLWGKGTSTIVKADGSGSSRSAKQPGKDAPSRMEAWQGELDAMKLAHEQLNKENNTFYEFGKRRELEFWQSKRAVADVTEKEKLQLLHRSLGLDSALRKDAFEAEMAGFKLRIDAAKNHYAERDAEAARASEMVRSRFGAESKEYREALGHQQQLAREHQEKLREIEKLHLATKQAAALFDTEQAIEAAEFEVQLGVRTKESLLELRRQAAATRLEIEIATINAEQAAFEVGTVEYEKLEAKRAEVRQKYRGEVGKVNREGNAQANGPLGKSLEGIQDGFQRSMDAIFEKGGLTMAKLRDIWKQTGQMFVREMVTKPLAEWAAMQLRKVLLNAGFLQAKNAQEIASAGVTISTEASIGVASIGVSAARAAAAAYAAIAGIPVVGPVLAPLTAAAALGAVLALGKRIFSAEGGFDIPSGMNPLVQTHAREMILPATYADVIRGMAANGGAAGGGGGGDMHVHVSAMDAKSFGSWLRGPAGREALRESLAMRRNRTV